jgi:putative transposase
MARPLRIQYPGAHYHITCRGIEGRRIYGGDGDRRKFIALLTESLAIYQVILYAYVLMQNHFHLLLQTRKANCAEFMRHFNICYTGWFNWRYHRCGNLYQGRYRAFLVDADSYSMEVSRYLHLNPVRVSSRQNLDYHEQWEYARRYRWSSMRGYLDETQAEKCLDYNLILSMVGGRLAYADFVIDGLRRGLTDPFQQVRGQVILGDTGFVKKVNRHIKRGSRREQPSFQALVRVMNAVEPEVLIAWLLREGGIDQGQLEPRRGNGLYRGLAAELLYRYCEITLVQIGQLLGGIDYMAVAQLRARFKDKLDSDAGLREKYAKLETRLKSEIGHPTTEK